MNRESRPPLFTADWTDVLFVHYRIADDAALQAIVPLELDRYDGDAYVSLVAFTQQRLRPTFGGRLTELLSGPLANHEFLNVRTYVRHADGTRAIFFLAEWIPNRLATLIGPRMYGLPYRLGRLRYERLDRRVEASGRTLLITASPPGGLSACVNGSLDAFLLERYTAFTHRAGVTRRFDVGHVPWPQVRVKATVEEDSLLELTGDWRRGAEVVAANYSPGVRDVTMTAPSASVARPRRRATSRWSPA